MPFFLQLNNKIKYIYNDINSFLMWIEKNVLSKYPYVSYVAGAFFIIKFFPQYSTIPVLLIVDKISRIIILETNMNIDINSTFSKYFLFNGFKSLIATLLTGLQFSGFFINNFLLELYNKYLIHKL